MRYLSIKATYWYGFFLCIALLVFALYMQLVWHLEPCILCMVQRFFVLALALLFLVGLALHSRTLTKVHALVLFVVSFLGALIAARQVWLQYFATEHPTNCAPSLLYMIQHLPLSQTLKNVMTGSGDCAVIDHTLMNLSIPVWTLLFFIAICVLAIVNWRKLSSHKSTTHHK